MFDPKGTELALFDLIKKAIAAFPFKTVARRGRIFPTPGIEGQPALYLIPDGWTTTQDQTFNLPKYNYQWKVLVYTRTDDNETAIPQDMLYDAAVAIIEAIGGVPPGYKQTLGGKVENCWIEGDSPLGTGLLDEQCSMTIPIQAKTGI